ncbi:MAG TPA: protein kinase, partial [Vicinamibacteria bacterium]
TAGAAAPAPIEDEDEAEVEVLLDNLSPAEETPTEQETPDSPAPVETAGAAAPAPIEDEDEAEVEVLLDNLSPAVELEADTHATPEDVEEEDEENLEVVDLSVEGLMEESVETSRAPIDFEGSEPARDAPQVAARENAEGSSSDAEVGVLLDALSPMAEAEAPDAPSASREATSDRPGEPVGTDEVGALLDRLSPTAEAEEPREREPGRAGAESESAPGVEEAATPAPPGDLDSILSGVLPPRPEPAPRVSVRFQAHEPTVAPLTEKRSIIDLAAVADEALSLPLTRPGIPLSREAHEAPSEPPPDSFGPYRLLERIAAGGMAEVFRAKRTGVEGFEKVLAVKRILPHLSDNQEFVEMFVHEAKIVAGLTHPNVVQIFDLGRIEKTYFIAMEYVHGKDLRSILKRAKERHVRIPLDFSLLIGARVCAALEYAHRKKDEEGRPLRIVHRDISPQNILISFEGDVKLTDFGIAKAASQAAETESGTLRGKLLYMSPEQASGRSLDNRSDVFSLGVVLYEMLTDAKPFLGTSEKGILELVRECRIEPPRSVDSTMPEDVDRMVMRALKKKPEERYQDASEMLRDLERALHERRWPAAGELGRFMEALFGEGELPPPPSVEAPPPTEQGDYELDLEGSGGDEASPPAPAKDDGGFGRLLKRFGIK